jgi:hypothetical protein
VTIFGIHFIVTLSEAIGAVLLVGALTFLALIWLWIKARTLFNSWKKR